MLRLGEESRGRVVVVRGEEVTLRVWVGGVLLW